jgi:hypothetical protein
MYIWVFIARRSSMSCCEHAWFSRCLLIWDPYNSRSDLKLMTSETSLNKGMEACMNRRCGELSKCILLKQFCSKRVAKLNWCFFTKTRSLCLLDRVQTQVPVLFLAGFTSAGNTCITKLYQCKLFINILENCQWNFHPLRFSIRAHIIFTVALCPFRLTPVLTNF